MKEDIEIINKPSSIYEGRTYLNAEAVIRKTCSYGVVEINPPLKIDIWIDLNEEVGNYTYDFGMFDKRPLKEKGESGLPNFLYDKDPIKMVVNNVVFDLEHAFNHTDIDPNYTHLHWALRAELRNRVKAWDWFDENEEQLEFNL